MLDLSRCRNLVEFDFGQALDQYLGTALEPQERPTSSTGLVGFLPGWFSCLAINPPIQGRSPSFMLGSVAHPMFQERGWKNAPLCENIVMVDIDLDDQAHARAEPGHDAELDPDDVLLTLRFTAQEVRADALGCAQHVCDTFIARQRKVLDDAFSEFLAWRAKCEKHPCTTLRRAPTNRQTRRSAARPPAFNRCLGWIDRQESEDAVGANTRPSALESIQLGAPGGDPRRRNSGRTRRSPRP